MYSTPWEKNTFSTVFRSYCSIPWTTKSKRINKPNKLNNFLELDIK